MTKLEKIKELKSKEASVGKLHQELLMAKGNFEKELQEFVTEFGGEGDRVDLLTLLEKALQHKESLIIS